MTGLALDAQLQRHRVVMARLAVPVVLLYLFGVERIPVHSIFSRRGALGVSLVLLGVATRTLAAGVLQKNRVLTTEGIYALVRNPLYLGSLLLVAGANLLVDHWLFLLASAALFAVTHLPAIRNEERGMHERYPEAWGSYARATPCLIPRLSRLPALWRAPFSLRRFRDNHEHHTLTWVVLILLLLELYGRWGNL